MGKDLRKRTVHAVLWSTAERLGRQGVQVAVQLTLARILGPKVFGLVAMLAIFNAIAQSVVDSGFGNALIQRKTITQTDICSVFYFNIASGVTMAGLLCLASPWIAAFYEQPLLQPLACFLSLMFVLNALGLTQDILLRREMDYRTQLKASVPAVLLSGSLAVTLALLGWGVWALAIHMVSQSLFKTSLLWVMNRWRPSWTFSWQSLREMFGFGSRMLASGILNVIFNNLYFLVVGKLFEAVTLGLYANARQLQLFVTSNISGIVSRVTFPVFSKVQDDLERVKRALSQALKGLTLVNSMAMFSLIVLAKPLFQTVLGEKWLPAIPYLQWLCVIGLLMPMHVMNLNVLMGLGRSDLFLRLEIAKKVFTMINVAVTFFHRNVQLMIYGQLITSIIAYFLNAHYSGKMLKYSAWRQLVDVIPYAAVSAFAAVVMCGAGALMDNWIGRHGWMLVFQLACQVIIGGVAWLALGRLLRLSAFMNLWNSLRSVRKRPNQ